MKVTQTGSGQRCVHWIWVHHRACPVMVRLKIKRLKSIWGIPRHIQAMKDVVRCDKRRGAANKL